MLKNTRKEKKNLVEFDSKIQNNLYNNYTVAQQNRSLSTMHVQSFTCSIMLLKAFGANNENFGTKTWDLVQNNLLWPKQKNLQLVPKLVLKTVGTQNRNVAGVFWFSWCPRCSFDQRTQNLLKLSTFSSRISRKKSY